MKKIILSLLLVLVTITSNVYAQGNVTYTGQEGNFVFEPGSQYSKTDLFPNFKEVMPGDTIQDQIEIKNTSNESVKIYLKVDGAHKGSEAFLNQMHLDISDGKQNIFSSSADSYMTGWILLGEYQVGESSLLNLELIIPIEMDDTYQETIGYLDWSFKVEKQEKPSIPNKGTPTGLNHPLSIGLLLLLVVSGAVLTKMNKRYS